MPEKSTPSGATGTAARLVVFGSLGCGGVALALVLVLVGTLALNSCGATDYPRIAPNDMADRVFRRSQEAYDIMGFTRTVPPGVERVGVSPENTLDAEYCYDGGPLGLEDKTVDGAYRLYHDWALDRVPASQAVPGLRRLHRRLRDEGWEVTSYREGGKGAEWSLHVRRDGDERMSFTWFPDRQYFSGGAGTSCAYDPGWRAGTGESYSVESVTDSVTVPDLGPSSAE
ncbi:hypothetical protein [Streptomyces sp. NPDC001307]|uniref:hypothetical protein n=1 Tax=Streptomyces sp. NPDC001307 TaxID=3364560 RepID=UPI0036BB7D00